MSRIGRKPIAIPQGVKIEQKGRTVKVSGPQGTLELDCHPAINVAVDSAANKIEVVNPSPENRECKQLHGTMRALLANMVTGVSKGFERKLEIYGTGYSVKEQGGKLILQIGFCHPVEMAIPKEIKVKIDVAATRGNEIPAKFSVSGIDKCQLGQFVANIRRVRPPEPYKGKGIRYSDEQVRRKVGKAFASGG
ncbi:MAG: 50S ribosomal protein L6 [Sedimentisphaerales bacterium]|nr:50S ribosomal protein L6 [Sedimentisphaerales bacterium]